MKCPKCQKNPAIIHPTFGVVWCKKCQDESENYSHGLPLNLTEGSDRIKKQREVMHDDLLQPHVYDKSSKKMVISEEFVNRYPDRVNLYYSDQEMRQAGLSKLAEHAKEVSRKEAIEKKRAEAYKEQVMATRSDPERVRHILEGLRR